MSEAIDALERPRLSPDELRPFLRRNTLRPTLALLRVFGLLALVVGMAATWGGWWIVAAFPIVAALQHAISILQHEAVHGLLYRHRRLNDTIGAVLLSYPIGFSLHYRQTHFAHHRSLGTEADPDAGNYRPFPAGPAAVLRKMVYECSGLSAARQFFRTSPGASGGRSAFFPILLVQGAIFGAFVLVGHPFLYLILWLLPLATLAKGFAQLRNMAEHLARPATSPASERIRTFVSSPIERFFIAPLNFNYHAEHHWYTSVPYYHLPALRAYLERHVPDIRSRAAWCSSYWSVWKEAAQPRPSPYATL